MTDADKNVESASSLKSDNIEQWSPSILKIITMTCPLCASLGRTTYASTSIYSPPRLLIFRFASGTSCPSPRPLTSIVRNAKDDRCYCYHTTANTTIITILQTQALRTLLTHLTLSCPLKMSDVDTPLSFVRHLHPPCTPPIGWQRLKKRHFRNKGRRSCDRRAIA